MSHPRIAVFARLATRNADPVRSIEGQATRLARTMHGIVYDPVHDEIAVNNPFADALLFFRGGAVGEEAPVRIIQGPSTYLGEDSLGLDPQHNEVYAPREGAVLVFPREGNGDVAPLRIIQGPKTQLRKAHRVAIDPVNNLVVVANDHASKPGIFIFNRTDNGDVAPRAIISGPKTGIIRPQAVQVDPERRQIIVAVTDRVDGPKQKRGFIGVWNYTDDGDVAPKATIQGAASMIWRPRGVAFSAKHKEVYVVDMRRNALFTYYFPQIF